MAIGNGSRPWVADIPLWNLIVKASLVRGRTDVCDSTSNGKMMGSHFQENRVTACDQSIKKILVAFATRFQFCGLTKVLVNFFVLLFFFFAWVDLQCKGILELDTFRAHTRFIPN